VVKQARVPHMAGYESIGEHYGFECAIASMPLYSQSKKLGVECGTHNGYVYCPELFAEYDSDYWKLDEHVWVHGGLTYGDDGWVGFDTGHDVDNDVDWNREAVIAETIELAKQLRCLAEGTEPEPRDVDLGIGKMFKIIFGE